MERDRAAGKNGGGALSEREGDRAAEAEGVGAGKGATNEEIIKMMEEDKKLKE